jgi:G3E family GTPase
MVAFADAESFSLDLFDSKPARNQLLYAEVILLNKCDLVGADRLCAVKGNIREVRDGARIIQTTRC